MAIRTRWCFEGHLYVIVSRQKESVEVLRVALDDLREDRR